MKLAVNLGMGLGTEVDRGKLISNAAALPG